MEETCSGWKSRLLTRVTSYISLPNVTNRSHEKQNVGTVRWRVTLLVGPAFLHIPLFRERSSEKVQATIPKGIVECFWVHCFSKKFERLARAAMDGCLRVLKESNKSRFDSYSVRNSVLIISHITFLDCRVHIFFSDNLSRNSCKHFGSTRLNQPQLVQGETIRACASAVVVSGQRVTFFLL